MDRNRFNTILLQYTRMSFVELGAIMIQINYFKLLFTRNNRLKRSCQATWVQDRDWIHHSVLHQISQNAQIIHIYGYIYGLKGVVQDIYNINIIITSRCQFSYIGYTYKSYTRTITFRRRENNSNVRSSLLATYNGTTTTARPFNENAKSIVLMIVKMCIISL